MTVNPFDQVKAQTLARFTEQGPGHINCAQAMVDFTMGILERDQGIITAARYLGGGVGGMGGTCGAITGTALALGLRDHYLGINDSERVASAQSSFKVLIRAFEQEHGACACQELTGHDISTPEGMEAFRASEARDRCPVYIAWMCDRLLPLLVDMPETRHSDAGAKAEGASA